jgi:hypothetical protein
MLNAQCSILNAQCSILNAQLSTDCITQTDARAIYREKTMAWLTISDGQLPTG